MPSLIRGKIARNIGDYGLGVFLKKLAATSLYPVFATRTYDIYVADLRKLPVRRPELPPGIEIRFIGMEEEEPIRQIENREEWLRGKLAGKLRAGQKCLTAMRGGDVAGFNLISFEILSLPAVRLRKPLRPAECSSEQITIFPEFRRLGLGAALRAAFFLEMREAGYRRIYGGTDASNAANRALTKKVGFRIFARARFLAVCGSKKLRVRRFRS